MSDSKLVDPPEDSEDESSSTTSSDAFPSSDDLIFENEPLVLELQALRDELPDNPLPEVKTRKLLKKRTRPKPEEQTSMASSSEESVLPTEPGEFSTEEFFDAHESYYEIPAATSESQKSPSAGVISNLAISSSDQTNSSKVQQATETNTRLDATTATPSLDSIGPPALLQTPIFKATPPTEPE